MPRHLNPISVNKCLKRSGSGSFKQALKLTFIAFLMTLENGCKTISTTNESRTVEDIHLRLAVLPGGLERFNAEGPFGWTEKQDLKLSTSVEEQREVDVYLTNGRGKAPIVLISHGNFSGKRAHAEQARRLATWGFHVIVLELPNREQWLENGKRIFDLVQFMNRWPKFLGSNADPHNIILVGHSFGGSAATLAIGQGAPVTGAVLLDPAVVHPSVKKAMTNAAVPAVLFGSDPKLFIARGRKTFLKNWGSEFMELTIKGATHDDAQGPSMFSHYALGVDPFTDDKQRSLFTASLVSAAISLATSGNFAQLRRDVNISIDDGGIEKVTYRSH